MIRYEITDHNTLNLCLQNTDITVYVIESYITCLQHRNITALHHITLHYLRRELQLQLTASTPGAFGWKEFATPLPKDWRK